MIIVEIENTDGDKKEVSVVADNGHLAMVKAEDENLGWVSIRIKYQPKRLNS